MIMKFAVKRFLARKRRDWRFYLDLSEDELDQRMENLPIKPPIWWKLDRKQKVCVLLGIKNERFLFLADTGAGKTLISLALILYFRKLKGLRKTLVLVPNLSNKIGWAREVKKHADGKLTIKMLSGTSEEKLQQLVETKCDIVVETYQGLITMFADLVKPKVKKKKKKKADDEDDENAEDEKPAKKKKGRMVPDYKLVAKVAALVECVVIDEITLTKRKSSLYYRIVNRFAHAARYCFGLTGTPFGRDVTALWAQMHMIDKGWSLGETLGMFRAAFFKESIGFGGWREYKFDKKKTGLLQDALAHQAIRIVVPREDRPEVEHELRYVELPVDAQAFYEKAKEALKYSFGKDRHAAENAFLTMRQISSGFIGFKDDETGERAKFTFDRNPKLDLVMRDVAKINPKHKFIIFHEFTHSGEQLCARLQKMGISFDRVWSGTKDMNETLARFEDDKSLQGLVFNFMAGGYGLNLQIAKHGLMYESPVPVIMRKQTEARFIRPYSPHKWVTLRDYITRGTSDEKILAFHREGGNLFKAVIGK